MHSIITRTDVYGFDELNEQAQQRAVDVIRQKLSSDWWDDGDSQDVTDEMTYELAILLGNPDASEHGAADFQGIEGVVVGWWSLDRSQDLAVGGRLDRTNAPRLPWSDGISHVQLTCRFQATIVDVHVEDDCCTCEPRPPVRRAPRWTTRHVTRLRAALLRQPHLLVVVTRPARCEPLCPARIADSVTEKQCTAMEQAVRNALGDAWQAGKRQEEFKSSESYARECIAGSSFEFTKDGDLY
ncbi:hypothetical protein DFR72_1011207 [Lentzea flaviverrucosa]|uniref:Uncharacterized protein n=2 Tax=Lentzea flaviverrucosa TaxID=200379 RepID=A0A1H9EKL1_9PSEU|nr:hypothetical protein DFR72_1011207 [Lentzea flaviverrucosa]SEQ26296.1 hypothetical protein SAMN05216195_10210 [Lentzea flaviverrucosa]